MSLFSWKTLFSSKTTGRGRDPTPAELLLCFGLAVGAYLATILQTPFGFGDEGFRYLLSRSWARGENLFEQYQVLYPTGQYAFFGTWMSWLGEDLWVLRFGRSLLGGLASVCLFTAVRRIGPALVAWATVFAFVVTVPPQAKVLATSLVILLALRLADRSVSSRDVLVASLAAGALAGWREDSAVLAGVVALAAVAIRREPRELATIVGPAAVLGFAPWWLIEGIRGTGEPFVRHVLHRLGFLVGRLHWPTHPTWPWPIQAPSSPRHLLAQSMPLLVAVPVLVYGLMVLWQVRRARAGRRLQRPVVVAASAGFAYLPQFVWERPDLPHFVHHLPVLLTALAIGGMGLLPQRRRYLAALAPLLLGVTVLVVAVVTPERPTQPYPCCAGARLGLRLHGHVPWAGLERRAGETLIVLGWAPGWYAAEDLEPGTRFLSTFRRHVSTPEREAELVRDLGRATNRWVMESSFEAPSSAIRALHRDYCRVRRWRRFTLWERCPEAEQRRTAGSPG